MRRRELDEARVARVARVANVAAGESIRTAAAVAVAKEDFSLATHADAQLPACQTLRSRIG